MVAFPRPGTTQPLPRQHAKLLPPGAGAVNANPSELPNNIINGLYSCAASEIAQQKIKDEYAETFPPEPLP